MSEQERRPIAARGAGWTRVLLRWLLATPVTPNGISLLSIVFAGLGAWVLVAAPGRPWLFLLAAGAIQLRLLCNLMDGLVAVEGGRSSSSARSTTSSRTGSPTASSSSQRAMRPKSPGSAGPERSRPR